MFHDVETHQSRLHRLGMPRVWVKPLSQKMRRKNDTLLLDSERFSMGMNVKKNHSLGNSIAVIVKAVHHAIIEKRCERAVQK